MSDYPITVEDVRAARLSVPERMSVKHRHFKDGPENAIVTVYDFITPSMLASRWSGWNNLTWPEDLSRELTVHHIMWGAFPDIGGPERTFEGEIKIVANALKLSDGQRVHSSYSVVPTPPHQRREIALKHRESIKREAKRAYFLRIVRAITEADDLDPKQFQKRLRRRRQRANQALAPDYNFDAVADYFSSHPEAVDAAAPSKRLYDLIMGLD